LIVVDSFYTNIREAPGTPESFHIACQLGLIQRLASLSFKRENARKEQAPSATLITKLHETAGC
jgi:hypothetical protein